MRGRTAEVLIIEGTAALHGMAAWLDARLRWSGIAVYRVDTVEDALDALTSVLFGVVVLDCDPYGRSAPLLIQALRDRPSSPRIIATGARSRLKRLGLAAADCLAKPLIISDLQARLTPPGHERDVPRLQMGDVSLHVVTQEVLVDGRPVAMSCLERTVLSVLMSTAPDIAPAPLLHEALFGHMGKPAPRAIAGPISRLRQHLLDAGATVVIESERGGGLRLSPSPQGGAGIEIQNHIP